MDGRMDGLDDDLFALSTKLAKRYLAKLSFGLPLHDSLLYSIRPAFFLPSFTSLIRLCLCAKTLSTHSSSLVLIINIIISFTALNTHRPAVLHGCIGRALRTM